MTPNTGFLLELNPAENSLSIFKRNLKCCYDNKLVYYYCLVGATMSLKPIQIPFVPIKPREDLDHHQVGPLTLKCTSWNRTTEN